MSARQPSGAGIWRRARSRFLMEDVEQQVRSRSPERQDVVARYHRAAVRRTSVADELSDARSIASAMLLYRDAVRLFIVAAVTAHDTASDPRALLAEADSPWEALASLSRRAAIAEPPAEVGAARKILDSEHEPLIFDESHPEQVLDQRKTIRQALAWLRGLVDPRTLRVIRAERLLRVSLLFAIAAAVVVLGAWKLVGLPNLALHRPVSISSRHPASTAPPDNSGVVNGRIESTYGVHTNRGGGWVTVDLEAVHRISQIKVFNRADGWFDEALPLRLESSEDGRQWKEIARRTTGFSASKPWVIEAQGAAVRFVRVASDKYVALTEIEIFGR